MTKTGPKIKTYKLEGELINGGTTPAAQINYILLNKSSFQKSALPFYAEKPGEVSKLVAKEYKLILKRPAERCLTAIIKAAFVDEQCERTRISAIRTAGPKNTAWENKLDASLVSHSATMAPEPIDLSDNRAPTIEKKISLPSEQSAACGSTHFETSTSLKTPQAEDHFSFEPTTQVNPSARTPRAQKLTSMIRNHVSDPALGNLLFSFNSVKPDDLLISQFEAMNCDWRAMKLPADFVAALEWIEDLSRNNDR